MYLILHLVLFMLITFHKIFHTFSETVRHKLEALATTDCDTRLKECARAFTFDSKCGLIVSFKWVFESNRYLETGAGTMVWVVPGRRERSRSCFCERWG